MARFTELQYRTANDPCCHSLRRHDPCRFACARRTRKVRSSAQTANDPCCRSLRRHDPCGLPVLGGFARFATCTGSERSLLLFAQKARSLLLGGFARYVGVHRQRTILVVIRSEGTILAVCLYSEDSQGSQQCTDSERSLLSFAQKARSLQLTIIRNIRNLLTT